MNARLGLSPAEGSAPNVAGCATGAPGSAASLAGPAARGAPEVAVIFLVRTRPGARLWGWRQVMLGARSLRHIPGLRFARALGSGRDGGFGLIPSLQHQGVFAMFDDDRAADAFIDRSALVAAYRSRAIDFWLARLRATACRGSWAGTTMAVTRQADAGAEVAALTRASIRPSAAAAFWRHAAPSQAALEGAHGCRLAIGLGEAPLLRQATFSVWQSTAAMDAYARQGAHQTAISAAHGGSLFSESMFVRFALTRVEGHWPGAVRG